MLIVNRVRAKMVKEQEMLAVEDVQEVLGTGVKLIGVVPDDEVIITSTNRGEPAVRQENSAAGQAYRDIVRRLLGEDVPFPPLEDKGEGFFEKIKKLFTRG
jgi:septum site-determining protein MinD